MKPVTACLAILLCASTAACMPTPPAQSVASATTAPAFVTMASASNAFEIETSRLALERSSDPGVRRFANRMISDHTKASQRMAQVVRQNGMTPPPPTLDARHAAMVQTLSATQGPAFDSTYLSMQATAHEEAITLFSTYAAQGDDPALQAFAHRTLPTLQSHAQMLSRSGGMAHAM
jgi:putative membrane protein